QPVLLIARLPHGLGIPVAGHGVSQRFIQRRRQFGRDAGAGFSAAHGLFSLQLIVASGWFSAVPKGDRTLGAQFRSPVPSRWRLGLVCTHDSRRALDAKLRDLAVEGAETHPQAPGRLLCLNQPGAALAMVAMDGPGTTGAQLRDLTLCGPEAAQGHEFMWAYGKDHRGSILN